MFTAAAPLKPYPLGMVVLILVAAVMAVVALDLSLRFVLGLGTPVLVTPDPACSYILKPNQNVYRFFCHTRTNRYGMRSAPFAVAPPPGTLRVMFVGDSITYGTSRIDQSQIFTQIIRRDLPSAVHRPVEVLNASAGGWAPDNELSWVRSRGTFHSQVVLLVLNSGDLAQPRADMSGFGDDTSLNPPSSALGELWTRWLKQKIYHLARRKDAGDRAIPDAGPTIRSNLFDLADFQRIVTAQHGEFGVVYIPFRSEIPNPSAQYDSILRTWTTAHHVPYIDLTSVEAKYPTKKLTLDGEHLSKFGNLVVARAIDDQCLNLSRSVKK